MNREEFSNIAMTLKAVYTDPKFLQDMDALKVWYTFLQDLDYQVASKAVARHICNNKWPPTIADIREAAADITAPPDEKLNELEAWALVSRAIRNSYYGAEKEFEELPAVVRDAVGNPANLREWGQMADESVSVAQSQFLRNYRTVVKRHKEAACLPVMDTLKKIMGAETERIEAS